MQDVKEEAGFVVGAAAGEPRALDRRRRDAIAAPPRITAADAPTDDDAADNGKTKKSEEKSGVCGRGDSLLRGPTEGDGPARFIPRVRGPWPPTAVAGGTGTTVLGLYTSPVKCVFGNCDAMRSPVRRSVDRPIDLSSLAPLQTAAVSLHTMCT